MPQNVPSVPQQTAIAAALQEAISALQSVLAQQAPAAAQEELDASQAPHVSPQGLGAAQEAPAPAQPAAQREQVREVGTLLRRLLVCSALAMFLQISAFST